MEKRPLIGIAVIVLKDHRILLGKRRNAHGQGTWAFPGGHLEFGEAIEDCARREVFEETGLCIAYLRLGPYTNDVFSEEDKHYVTLFVLADWQSGEPRAKEPQKCERWEWFQWPPGTEPLFLPIRNLIKRGFTI